MVVGSCHPGIAAGMAALQLFYNTSTGLWKTTEWWNSANALETTIEYSRLTNTSTYRNTLSNTFEKQKHNKFLNPWFRDDDGWWALAWIKAYDLTGETRYLAMAKTIFAEMRTGWDSSCGGGLWWLKKQKNYKNAITTSLFLSVAARLHLRTPNDKGSGSYLDWAERSWQWMNQSGMINGKQLVNDGLDSNCRNNGKPTWTYNQGVLVGGLVDLYKSTNDPKLLKQAQAIADASIKTLAPKGILREVCEPRCGDDGAQFKGVFMRNLSLLYQVSPKETYRNFIMKNAMSILANRHRSYFGLSWSGKLDRANAARQSSALDALNAAIAVNAQNLTYQAESASLNQLSLLKGGKGYQGKGYVANWNRDGQWITFNVDITCSGKYDLALRYASEKDASRNVYINGKSVVENHHFSSTGNWSLWRQTQLSNVKLNSGRNTVSIIFNRSKGSQHNLKLDELAVMLR
jgi:predicted alpha-1,6-mannanase (GH76 family)